MSQTGTQITQSKPFLAVVQLITVAITLAVFYLFYVWLGNSLLIALPLAAAVALALWQLLVVPLQKRVAQSEAVAQSLATTAQKVTELGVLASKINNLALRAKVLEMAEHFRYALNVQRNPSDPLAQLTAQTLTDVALGSTLSVVTSYLKLASKRQPTTDERATLRKTEAFIPQLATALDGQIQRLQTLAAGQDAADAGLETNLSTLQMLFEISPTEKDLNYPQMDTDTHR